MEILGVKIDNLSKKEILEKVRIFLDEPKFHQIATINPEIILEAQKNPEFKNILRNCNLSLADGFGVKLAFWRFGKNLKCWIAGADLMLEILKIASEKKLSIFLATNKDGLSNFEEIKKTTLKIYPNLEIYGEDIDIKYVIASVAKQSPGIQQNFTKHEIASSSSTPRNDILFCNFGAPHQEIFINSVKCDSIRLAMGVGGGFDFITGKIRRAPYFMRLIGLEWLWRLIQQPKRFRRIWNAVIIFSIKVLLNK